MKLSVIAASSLAVDDRLVSLAVRRAERSQGQARAEAAAIVVTNASAFSPGLRAVGWNAWSLRWALLPEVLET
jgi:hypothetical protein